MINRNGLIAFNWSLTAWASAVLGERLPALARASPEGTDPFAVLETAEERAAGSDSAKAEKRECMSACAAKASASSQSMHPTSHGLRVMVTHRFRSSTSAQL